MPLRRWRVPACVGERGLRGALGDGDALQADRETGVVHHGEHASHAAVLLADEVAGGAAPVAIDHGAGGRGVEAELVLDRVGAGVVAGAERTVGIDQKFRHQEQRHAARSGRRVRQPRQHQVDDIVGQIMLAIGDEDFLAADAVGPVAGALRPRAQGPDIGARLRLGELHGAHPLAGDESWQKSALERVGAVGNERVDAGHGQDRPEPERHGGRVPHLDAGGVERMRQMLAAPLRGRREPIPAGRGPGAIGLLPARRRGDDAVLELRAAAVADRVERRQHLGGKAARLFEHCVDHVIGEVAIEALAQRRPETGGMAQRKADVADRRLVAHGKLSRVVTWTPGGRNIARPAKAELTANPARPPI